MSRLFACLLSVSAVLALSLSIRAEDPKKEIKPLAGKVCCAKCELKVEGLTKCATVVVVKEKVKDKDEDVIYWFDDDSHKKYHDDICQAAKEGTVTYEKLETKDNKKYIKVTKIEYK